ncbi:MAG: aminotransferase class V-fold PLP-dependent enzyme [Firmicutes bacterium]|nr:aminotransferase class V-fold PLP-dependent enzyme [Bacillota bacterium]
MSKTTSRRLSLDTIANQVVGIHQKVPVYKGKRRRYINFDNAASTPTLQPVMDKIVDFLPWYAGVHRSTGYKSLVSTAAYEAARLRIGRFFGADPNHHVIIFGKNTTEAINLLAHRLQLEPHDIVLTTLMEHHSNDLPWRQTATVIRAEVERDGQLDMEDMARKLALYHHRIKLVAISGASNVTGWINDIHGAAILAHSYGIPIMVDGAQLAAHRPINLLSPEDPRHIDFLAISGHKLYAPFGTGVLIGPYHIFQQGNPSLMGGGTVKLVTTTETMWADPPAKDEAGSPNVIGAVALASALEILDQVGLDNIVHHGDSLTDYALTRLLPIPGLKLYGSTQVHDRRRLGVMSFELRDFPHALVAALLAFYAGIGVRSGCFCAQPYIHRLLGIDKHALSRMQEEIANGSTQNLPGLVRISFGIYNTTKEIDHFLNAIQEIQAHSPTYWLQKLSWDEKLGCYIPKGKSLQLLKAGFRLCP